MAILRSLSVIERTHSNLFGSATWLVRLILVVILWGINLREWIKRQKRQGLREIVWNVSVFVPVAMALTAGMEAVGWITILRPNLYAGIRAVCALEVSIVLCGMVFRMVRNNVPIGDKNE